MKILKHGSTISQEVSEFLKEFTTAQDIADVNAETGIGVPTLQYVKRRAGNVSQENEKGMLLLIQKAYENAESKRKAAMKCKKVLEPYLPKVTA